LEWSRASPALGLGPIDAPPWPLAAKERPDIAALRAMPASARLVGRYHSVACKAYRQHGYAKPRQADQNLDLDGVTAVSVRRSVLFLVDAPPALGAERHLLQHVLVVAGLTISRARLAIARLGRVGAVVTGLQTLLLPPARRVGMSGKTDREQERHPAKKACRCPLPISADCCRRAVRHKSSTNIANRNGRPQAGAHNSRRCCRPCRGGRKSWNAACPHRAPAAASCRARPWRGSPDPQRRRERRGRRRRS